MNVLVDCDSHGYRSHSSTSFRSAAKREIESRAIGNLILRPDSLVIGILTSRSAILIGPDEEGLGAICTAPRSLR
jgi:hypothetical protein